MLNELDYFYFHPDHLGSSSYITNAAGTVSQHMEYLPFGELLVDEHTNSYNSPFKYNGKEFDEETGNYYYSARYYDPKLSIFISVDPLAESYPDWSSYTYVYNNPIRWTDSTGMCPDGDCPDNPVIGQVHNSPEFGELVFDGQTWTITKCPQVLFLAFQEAPHHCKLPVRLPCPQNLLLKELMIF